MKYETQMKCAIGLLAVCFAYGVVASVFSDEMKTFSASAILEYSLGIWMISGLIGAVIGSWFCSRAVNAISSIWDGSWRFRSSKSCSPFDSIANTGSFPCRRK